MWLCYCGNVCLSVVGCVVVVIWLCGLLLFMVL